MSNSFDNHYKMHIEKYGNNEYQEGDLYIPNKKTTAVICLLHGGFWRMPYGREQLTPIAVDLTKKGFVVWNIEYRRIGAGGGWHGTFDDVISSINHLVSLKEKHKVLDLSMVIIVGHSAGGHLAIWCAKQSKKNAISSNILQIKPYAIVGLAPVINLEKAFADKLGNNAVAALLNGSPNEHPERYSLFSPIELLPINTRQLIMHGNLDEDLPVEWSREYVNASRNAGDEIEYIEISNGEHMDYLDPNSEAIGRLQNWLIENVNYSSYQAK